MVGDYEQCATCGFDHEYEFAEAQAEHIKMMVKGTIVRARANVQGLKEGCTYEVKNIFLTKLNTVEVEVERVAEYEPRIFVKNPTMVLEEVDSTDALRRISEEFPD